MFMFQFADCISRVTVSWALYVLFFFLFFIFFFSLVPVITDIWTAKIVSKNYFQLMIAQNWFLVRIISLSTLSGFSTSLTRKEFSILMRHNANIASAKNRLNGVENLFCSCVSKICWLPWNGRNHFGPVHPKFFTLESQKATAFVIL